jgi:MtrB/PioB family decaheme-associated outer membrane protein
MRTSKHEFGVGHTIVALSVLAAFEPAARAQDIGELTGPGSSITIGAGYVSGDEKDRARFGMFNGLRDHSVNGLLGFTYLNRDNASGRWTAIEGRNLGLDSRELGVSIRQLGDWKFTGEYSELVRHDPRTINTGMAGAGTTTPTISRLTAPGTGQDLNLELKRKSLTLGGDKWLTDTLQVEVTFKNEDKDGGRQFGRGFACSAQWQAAGVCTGTTQSALLLLVEPVNSNIKQLDAKLNWNSGNLRLSGGYYGSFYTNSNGNLTPTVTGNLVDMNGVVQATDAGLRNYLGTPMALWPDNQAHQVFLAGNYRFTPKTLMNFKYSYTHATQDEGFASMGLSGAPAGRGDLGGVVDSTKAQVGFSSRPVDKLHVYGDLKYDKRKDKTPIALYNTEQSNPPAVGSPLFTNGQYSPTKWNGKLEASYNLPANYVATAGLFYDKEDLGTFEPSVSIAGLSGLRQKFEEKGYRLEMRKYMSETLNGAVSFAHSKREGDSPWLKPNSLPLTGVTEVTDAQIFNRTAIFPFIFMDRKRDKVRLMSNWSPDDRLSVQLFADYGVDRYSAPTEHGLRDTSMRLYSVDVAYALSAAWKLTGYASRGRQTVHAGHSTGYDAALQDTNDSAGLGLIGRLAQRAQAGVDLTWLNDNLKYDQRQDPLASAANAAFLAASGGLPDVTYRLLRLRLFGEYGVQKNAFVRLNFIHQRTFFNEWTYNFNGTPFLFADNTTLSAQQNQSVNFVGLSYVYKFQ